MLVRGVRLRVDEERMVRPVPRNVHEADERSPRISAGDPNQESAVGHDPTSLSQGHLHELR